MCHPRQFAVASAESRCGDVVATTRWPLPGYRRPGMAVDVVTEIRIDRPVGAVASYMADPSHAPEWYANIDSVEWVTEPPVGVGSRVAFVARFLGRTLRYTYEVVSFDPASGLVMRTAEGPFPMETTYSWRAVPEGTLVALRNRGQPSGFAAVGTPFIGAAMRRANRKDLLALKRVVESHPR